MDQQQVNETFAAGFAGKKYIQELGTKGKIAAGVGGLAALGGAAWALKRGDTEQAEAGLKKAAKVTSTQAAEGTKAPVIKPASTFRAEQPKVPGGVGEKAPTVKPATTFKPEQPKVPGDVAKTAVVPDSGAEKISGKPADVKPTTLFGRAKELVGLGEEKTGAKITTSSADREANATKLRIAAKAKVDAAAEVAENKKINIAKEKINVANVEQQRIRSARKEDIGDVQKRVAGRLIHGGEGKISTADLKRASGYDKLSDYAKEATKTYKKSLEGQTEQNKAGRSKVFGGGVGS